MRAHDIDQLLLGLEIASASADPELRRDGRRHAARLIRNMDETTALRVRDRLARVVGVEPPPETAVGWRRWATSRGRDFDLAAPAPRGVTTRSVLRPLVSTYDDEVFARLMNYLDSLHTTDLEMAIVMDSTSSMQPMINEARIGVERLILFFSDIAGSMRLGFIAYRDHDNEPVWEGEHLTSDLDAMRRFLWGIQITGGRDLPEAVLEGLEACGQLDWSPAAEKRIVLVGDARPHDEDEYRIMELLESVRSSGIVVHAAHVPMRLDPRWERHVSAAVRDAYAAEIRTHNARTEAAFDAIAHMGGGERVTLMDARELVPRLMRLTINEAWWPAFDEFYAVYLEVCR